MRFTFIYFYFLAHSSPLSRYRFKCFLGDGALKIACVPSKRAGHDRVLIERRRRPGYLAVEHLRFGDPTIGPSTVVVFFSLQFLAARRDNRRN